MGLPIFTFLIWSGLPCFFFITVYWMCGPAPILPLHAAYVLEARRLPTNWLSDCDTNHKKLCQDLDNGHPIVNMQWIMRWLRLVEDVGVLHGKAICNTRQLSGSAAWLPRSLGPASIVPGIPARYCGSLYVLTCFATTWCGMTASWLKNYKKRECAISRPIS